MFFVATAQKNPEHCERNARDRQFDARFIENSLATQLRSISSARSVPEGPVCRWGRVQESAQHIFVVHQQIMIHEVSHQQFRKTIQMKFL